MKKTLFLLGAALCSMFAIVGCDKGNTPPDNACTVWIYGQDREENKSLCEFRSKALIAAQICRIDTFLFLVENNDENTGGSAIECKINSDNENDASIDTIDNRIGLRVLHVSAALNHTLFEKDMQWLVLHLDTICGDFDTVAYIPQSKRLAVIDTLTYLFDASNGGWEKNYEAINEIVQSAFSFIPCTGEEFKQIKYTDQN